MSSVTEKAAGFVTGGGNEGFGSGSFLYNKHGYSQRQRDV